MRSAVVLLALLSLLVDTVVEAQVCSSSAFPMGVDIDTSGVSWGNGAPCAGHLIADDANLPMCGFIDHRAAERACWDMDLHTATLGSEKQRRYRCIEYSGPTTSGITALVATQPYWDLGTGGLNGQSCLGGDPDCFMDCHGAAGSSVTYALNTNCLGNPDQTAITCTDINECTDGILYDCTGPFQEDCDHRSVVCGPNADCADTPGSYTCMCALGYEAGDAYDPAVGCVDTDECDTANTCGADAVCENTPGSYICMCDAGYTWDDSTDTCDINTCMSLSSIANAVLTPGNDEYGSSSSYDCDSGYEPSIAGSSSFSMRCRDDGTYCACSAPSCERIKCDHPGFHAYARTPVTSREFESTLTYTCETGYSAGGAPSYSVDCQANGRWENPSTRCQDINECDDLAQPCPTYSTCFNTIGSHLCVCDPGYEGDKCDEVSCGDIPVVANSQITTSVSASDGIFGQVVNYRCEAGYHVSYANDPNSVTTNFDLECKQDGCWSPQPIPQCIPVSCGDPGVVPHAKRSPGNFFFGDEISYTCVEGYRPSDYAAHTHATYHTYTINCGSDGMWSPRPYCADINECLENNHPCGPGGGHICINEVGSYTCSCAAYYRLDQSGHNCVGFPVKPDDVTEPCNIYTSLAMCNWGTCQYNDLGKPHCWCEAGYTGAFCDQRIDEQHELNTRPFIMSIVSLGLAILALMIAVSVAGCYCCCGSHRRSPVAHIDHHVDHAPIYQGTPPLGPGYPGSGFVMALRNKATNALYPMGQ